MMSIGMVKSSMDVHKYFIDKDNYYLTDKSEIQEAAQWYGKGAVILGLLNEGVEENEFLSLLKGKMPDGQQIGQMRDNSVRHRPATDLTFSAPKSVSVMALVQGDRRLVEAHNRAVEKTLDAVEALYAEARKTVDGVTDYEKTNNLLIARFRHTTSRELDAQLHTHSVIINATMRDDKLWRALSSRQKNDMAHINHGFRENVMANQHYLGMIYNSTLAKGAVECGYQISVNDQYGNFDIQGLDKDYLKSQSKRRDQILTVLEERGLTGSKAAGMAALSSREAKQSVDMDTVKKYWTAEAKQHDVDLDAVYQQSLTPKDKSPIDTALVVLSCDAKQAVVDAVTHLSEYSVMLSHSDLIRQAFIFSGGLVEHEVLERAVSEQLKHGQLIGKAQHQYTTQTLLATEKQLKRHFQQSRGTSFQLNLHQSGVVAKVLNHSDRSQVVDVRGLKNEIKLLNEFVRLSEANQLTVTVLHPNQSSLNRLTRDVKREPRSLWERAQNLFKPDVLQTVSHFKDTYPKRISPFLRTSQHDIIVVADAQKLSYTDAKALDELAEQRGAKLVMLNNSDSTLGFRAGNTIKLMKDSGVVQHRSGTASLKSVVELTGAKQPVQALADAWTALADRPTLVAVNTASKTALTQAVREQLQIRGELGLYSRPFTLLSTRGLSAVQKTKTQFYGEGDHVTLQPFSSQQWHGQVTGIDKEKQLLTLVNHRGQEGQLDLGSDVDWDVKKKQNLSLAVGEQLRTTRRLFIDRHTVIEKNTTMTVSALNEDGARVQVNDQSLWLSRKKLAASFMDYGYVVKPHQLSDESQVMTALTGYQLNQRQVGEIKEYAKHIVVFTDDAEKASHLLDKQRTAWLASDIGDPRKGVSDPIIRSDAAIAHDLNIVARALCGDEKATASTAVSYGLALLGEREAGFKLTDLIQTALSYALGHVDHDEIDAVIEQKTASGELLIPSGVLVTTQQAHKLESAILSINEQGKGQVEPVYQQPPILQDFLTPGQRDAVTLALTTSDRFIAIQGLAGTGKTTMMKELLHHASAKDFTLVGIAPTHKAVEKLAESLADVHHQDDIQVITAHKFLGEDGSQFSDKTIFIADEASMLSNRLFHDVQQKVVDCQGREIYLGDINQQAAIESGKPLELSIDHGIRTATMNEIVRQTEKSALKSVVALAAKREAAPSLQRLQPINPQAVIKRMASQDLQDEIALYRGATESFIEVGIDKDNGGNPIFTEKGVPSLETLYQTVANDYLTRVPEQRAQTIVVASLHASRDAIEASIREGLKKEGIIQDEVPVSRLVSRNLDQAQLLHVKHYQVGDIVRFNQGYSIGKRGDHFSVESVDQEKNLIVLKGADENTYRINLASIALKAALTVHEHRYAEIGIGDRLRLRQTNRTLGWQGGKEYTVTSLEKGVAVVKDGDDDTLVLNLDRRAEQHWDFAYTNTTYSVQGDTAKYVIGVEINDNFRSNYIQVSRASQHTVIYTADKAWLLRHLSDAQKQHAANKQSAIEVMTGAPSQEKIIHTKTEKSQQPHQENKESFVSAKTIQPLLDARFKELAVQLLGDPNPRLSSESQLRFGKKGSLSVNLNTNKWHSFETGEGGGAFGLIQQELGLRDFKAALDYAVSFVNYQPTDNIKPQVKEPPSTPIKAPVDTAKQVQMKRYGQQLEAKSQPLHGTLGEIYLRQHRDLSHIDHADIRFLPSITGYKGKQKVQTPAILAIARDKNRNVHHVQVIRLDQAGQKNKAVSIAKQTYGTMQGYAVELNKRGNQQVTYLAEGVETGLSILSQNPKARVLAVLGKSNFLRIDLEQLANKVILCLDNDGSKTFTDKTILEAVKRLEHDGKQVRLVIPELPKQDFNDVLKEKGRNELNMQLNRLMTPATFKKMGQPEIIQAINDSITMTHLLEQVQQPLERGQAILPLHLNSDTLSENDVKKILLNQHSKAQQVNHLAADFKQADDTAFADSQSIIKNQSRTLKQLAQQHVDAEQPSNASKKITTETMQNKHSMQQALMRDQVENIVTPLKKTLRDIERER